jgi:hypothetical protein
MIELIDDNKYEGEKYYNNNKNYNIIYIGGLIIELKVKV